ncbi:MAG: ABC transporter permease [Gemmatimonadota bacterium]
MRIGRGTIAKLGELVRGHLLSGLRSAVEAVRHNRLRAALTSLGILFGVASVIAMLAIGKGAEQEILTQMQLLGTNNVIVAPLVEQSEEELEEESEREVKRFSPGLTYEDADAIAKAIPGVEATSAEIVYHTFLTREDLRRSGRVVGVDTTYFRLVNLNFAEGVGFSPMQVERGLPVAIIGHGVRTRFFTTEDPLGKPLKLGNVWVTVVGVLEDRRFSEDTSARLGIRDANMDVYVPTNTMLLRFRNRTLLTQRDIEAAAQTLNSDDEDEDENETEQERRERTNLHQLDRIIVRVGESALVPPVANVMRRLLERRHNDVIDFEITIPELLLRQEQRTKTIFNVVLGSIAAISLVVGGIGIMNIMLASVLERIKEIGVRRAVGATRHEILFQFLMEAVLISVVGGTAGILVGMGLSLGIERLAGIETIVSYLSVAVAFGVSFAVGIAFGIMPAHRAAHKDPVACLRHE